MFCCLSLVLAFLCRLSLFTTHFFLLPSFTLYTLFFSHFSRLIFILFCCLSLLVTHNCDCVSKSLQLCSVFFLSVSLRFSVHKTGFWFMPIFTRKTGFKLRQFFTLKKGFWFTPFFTGFVLCRFTLAKQVFVSCLNLLMYIYICMNVLQFGSFF